MSQPNDRLTSPPTADTAADELTSRRKLLALALGASATLPARWVKPVVDAVILPVHAQASPPPAPPPPPPGPAPGGGPMSGVVGNIADRSRASLVASLFGQCVQIDPASDRGYEEGAPVTVTIGLCTTATKDLVRKGPNEPLTLEGSLTLAWNASGLPNCRPSPMDIAMQFDVAVPPLSAIGLVDGFPTQMTSGACPSVPGCGDPAFHYGEAPPDGTISIESNSRIIATGAVERMILRFTDGGGGGLIYVNVTGQILGSSAMPTVAISDYIGSTTVTVEIGINSKVPYRGEITLANICGRSIRFDILYNGFPPTP